MDQAKAEELVRRLATALRGTELYSPTHPLVQRGIDDLVGRGAEALQAAPSVVIGFIGDEIVVDGTRLPRGTAALVGFARDLREREIEKVTLTRGLTREEIRGFIAVLADRQSTVPLPDRLAAQRRPPHHARHESSSRRSPTTRPASPPRAASTRRRSRRPNRCGRRPRPAISPTRRGAQDHRRPGATGDPGPHVADGADRAEEVRQLHVHAHGERLGAGHGAGALAQHRRRRCCASSGSRR